MRSDRPSSTARLIAQSVLLSAAHPTLHRLLSPGDADCVRAVLQAAGRNRPFDIIARQPWGARWLWRMERAVLPGIVAHYLARKRWLDRVVTRQLRAGVQQVVVLGAGFDTLAWRRHRASPAVKFFELDHPATQTPKRHALVERQSNLTFVATDLGRELPSAALQRTPQFDRLAPTLFLAEGLLMYFSGERVNTLLRDLGTHPSAALAFSFMEPDQEGRAAFRGGRRWVDAWLRLVREPFGWSLPRLELASFLAGVGWKLEAFAAAAELRAAILAPAGLHHVPLAEGECLGTALALS